MQARAKKSEGGSGGGLFEPDILLPNQYFAAFRRGRAVEGERRLMLAVLEDAVDSYRKYALAQDPREQACFLEAKEWFVSQGWRSTYWYQGRRWRFWIGWNLKPWDYSPFATALPEGDPRAAGAGFKLQFKRAR